MPKIDAYLRSIERFGATGALLSSGQSITLRFPTGDRHATQVTPHELLVAMIREVAPPAAWSTLESQRGASFALESGGNHFALTVVPTAGQWQVSIEGSSGADVAISEGHGTDRSADRDAPASARSRAPAAKRPAAAPALEIDNLAELSASLAIERTPYDDDVVAAGSGSQLLDQLMNWARTKGASDLVLAAGAPAMARVAGGWVIASEQKPIDGDVLAREIGVISPPAARASWAERGEGSFAADDANGRLRVRLGRDSNGPRATIRFVAAHPVAAQALGIPEVARHWLDSRRGLIIVAGGAGCGKSTTWASLVHDIASQQNRSIVTIEDPIEILHRDCALVSQRELGSHVASVAAGVTSAMREGADVIAVSHCVDADAVHSVVTGVEAGHLMLISVDASSSAAALARLTEPSASFPAGRDRDVIAESTLGVLVQHLVGRRDGAGRLAAFEVVPGGGELPQLVRERRWDALPEVVQRRRGDGAISLRDAVAELMRLGYAAER
jgi:twitching motility protein PilT